MTSTNSPCIKVCTLDLQSRICIGCGRTLAEIGNWLRYNDAERLQVMALIPERLEKQKKPNAA